MSVRGWVGFYAFDWGRMESSYGRQAFEAIARELSHIRGTCFFYDGDIWGKTLPALIGYAQSVTPCGVWQFDNPLGSPAAGGASIYLAAAWFDPSSLGLALHHRLNEARAAGYLGFIALDGEHPPEAYVGLASKLHLPAGLGFRDGEVVKGTAKHGIGVRRPDSFLLHAAALGELDGVIEALRDGADIECISPDDRRSTPLFLAAAGGHGAVVDRLLSRGADPNATNGSNSALMIAARRGHAAVVAALIAHRVDVNAMDSSGGTALDNAKGKPEIEAMLRKAGAI